MYVLKTFRQLSTSPNSEQQDFIAVVVVDFRLEH